MIPELRRQFNASFASERYEALLAEMEKRCGTPVQFRVAETPIFVLESLLDRMANEGAELARCLISDPAYLAAARGAIPPSFNVANENSHPHFLTADFSLIRNHEGMLEPKLVEIQAFPSVFGYQAVLCDAYREAYNLPETLGFYIGGLSEDQYWDLLRTTVLGSHLPENVVLSEIDPLRQKTLPDFAVTAERLGIAVVDITSLKPIGNKLHYRNAGGEIIPIHRIYNRAIADELIARDIRLPFDLTHPWEVEWAGHPNWYFLISKFSIPWLSRSGGNHAVVPPAAFLSDFLEGRGRVALAEAGVPLPDDRGPGAVYSELLLKPLFSFAGRGIEFEPTQARLDSIPVADRGDYLVQQRMRF